jgi:hypothetical protein
MSLPKQQNKQVFLGAAMTSTGFTSNLLSKGKFRKFFFGCTEQNMVDVFI